MGKGILVNIPPDAKTTLHAIAYLDLLGTTAKISSDKQEKYLFDIYTIYNTAVMCCNDPVFSETGFNRIKTKIFSDNIIMAIPLESEQDAGAVNCLLRFVAQFQNIAALSYCWLIRGGITVGELFLDDLLVWGTGLVRAYELESHIAVYPRIVIERSVLDAPGVNGAFFRRDIDGQTYLNYLPFVGHFDAQGNDALLSNARDRFEAMHKEIRRPDGSYDEKAHQKLQWHKHYINAWYRETHPDATELPIPDAR